MKHEELKQALRLIAKVLNDSKIGPSQGKELQRVKRELQAVARSGKFDQRRLFRAVEIVARVMVDIVEQDADQRQK